MKTYRKVIQLIGEILIAGSITIVMMIIYFQFVRSLPHIHIEDFQTMPQASLITDREGNELFRFYKENRRRVSYPNISHHMVNAIVATEDEGFWINQGIEPLAILRATRGHIQYQLGIEKQTSGASTITQQLVKNVLLSQQKTIKRKLQEIILAQRLTNQRINTLQKENPTTNKAIIEKQAKESILETYLNYVYYGNHAYGIDAAVKNYFHTQPSELTISQSAILASLPQSPSRYNPTVNTDIVMGQRKRHNRSGEKGITYPHQIASYIPDIHKQLEEKILIMDNTSCLESIKKRASDIRFSDYIIKYHIGRKDRVLCRMYKSGYITPQDIRDAFIESTTFQLHTSTNVLEAPHFVFWIQKIIQEKNLINEYHINDQTFSQAGRTIRTSLHPTDQAIAQETITQNMHQVYENGGNNRALIHVDSLNGDVLAYVGSADYYNTTIKGQNDIIQATRQVGSTIKPFVYAYLFTHFDWTTDSTISDFPLPAAYATEGQPSNVDRLYRGHIAIKHALAGSRNIPPIRIFYALGKEKIFVPYLRKLGFRDLQNEHPYGYSLILGAGEGSVAQLANAYIQLSTDTNDIATINPILSITDHTGEIIYQKETDTTSRQERTIPLTVSYMIWSILSNITNAPQKRYYHLSIPSIEQGSYAIKTGTSEKKYGKTSLPNDARIATYTNRDVIISRAGHTDGKALGAEGYGLSLNHRVIKDYYRKLHEQNLILGGQKNLPAQYQGVYPPVIGKEPNTNQSEELLQK